MDERNPFLDEQTLNRVKIETNTNRGNNSKNTLLNYSDILMEHYSAKNSNRYNSSTNLAPGIIYQVNSHSNRMESQQLTADIVNSNSSMLL